MSTADTVTIDGGESLLSSLVASPPKLVGRPNGRYMAEAIKD
jgi:hypothetical protein